MYAKDRETITDRREMLRVKLKSLAAEAQIIRREERRTHGQLRNELHQHRVGVLRRTTRHTHLAYGFIRGRTLEQMEVNARKQIEYPDPSRLIDWALVQKMITRYGSKGMTVPVVSEAVDRFSRRYAELMTAAQVQKEAA